jgi:hypothetical protein
MFNSKEYWEKRYLNKNNSGAGSYGCLAEFKSEIINDFLDKNNIVEFIDYGVGDGNQLKLINTKNRKYTGIDISPTIIEKCKYIFKNDSTKLFICNNEIKNTKAELVLSCDVLYHLVEDEIYNNYMKTLFNMSKKFVIIYAKNEDLNHVQHVKFRKFTNYINQYLQNWKLIKHIPNKYPQLKIGQNNNNTSPSDFYIFKKIDVKNTSLPISQKNNENSIPIYISLTSIFKNQNILLKTLQSIIAQTKIPDKIFLYLSEAPYILDTGFINRKISDNNLLNFLEINKKIIQVSWVENEGSYRKLLPLLKEKWNENCIIITIDDDTIYHNKLIENLVEDYNKQKCVISYRGYMLKMNKLEEFDYLKRINCDKKYIFNFPTGKGGILYKPEFFHKTSDLIFNKNIYLKYCSKQDDIWFYILRIKNNISCYLDNKPFQISDLINSGLFVNFNSKNNINTKVFHEVIKQLK